MDIWSSDPKDPNIIYLSEYVRADRPLQQAHQLQPGHYAVAGIFEWDTEINERKYRDPWTPVLVLSAG